MEAKDCKGRTPLHRANSGWQPEVAKSLIDRGARPDLYVPYAGFQTEAVARFLKEYPQITDVNGPDGNRPLHYASQQGEIEVVRLLLERGAEVGATNKAGETALDLARKNGHKGVVELLTSRGSKR